MSAPHLLFAAAIGGVSGALLVLGLSWTVRLVAAGGYRAFAISWRSKAAIILAAMAVYLLIGSGSPPAPMVVEAAAPESAAKAVAGPAWIDAGGITLSFAPPTGYCLYPAPLLEAVIVQQKRRNPDNTIHTVFGDCGELQEAAATGARIRDFGILMTPKAFIGEPMDRQGLDRMVAQSPDPVSVKAALDQQMAQAKTRLGMPSLSALGILDRDKAAIYFGYLAEARLGEEAFDQAYVMALTVVGGRLISYSLYTDYVKDPRPVLFGLVNKLKLGIADFRQRNG